jgi:hypothetical protein
MPSCARRKLAARSRNIQFGIIALIVITLGIFLLIFSRTSVVGAKAIKNLSLIALLLFFEFINLLVHPFLGASHTIHRSSCCCAWPRSPGC